MRGLDRELMDPNELQLATTKLMLNCLYCIGVIWKQSAVLLIHLSLRPGTTQYCMMLCYRMYPIVYHLQYKWLVKLTTRTESTFYPNRNQNILLGNLILSQGQKHSNSIKFYKQKYTKNSNRRLRVCWLAGWLVCHSHPQSGLVRHQKSGHVPMIAFASSRK